MKLFSQRDVSSCPRHCKGNFETWMLPTHSRHNITFHPWFLLCFLPFPSLEVHTRFAGEEITKNFFYFAWHEYARHPSGNEKKSRSDLSEEATKQSESPDKARVSHRRLQVHAVVIFKQFSGRDSSSLRIGRDLLILAGKSHLRFFVHLQQKKSSKMRNSIDGRNNISPSLFLSVASSPQLVRFNIWV